MLQKYFIAIIPPEPVFSQIENIKKEVSEKYNNKSALRSPSHITLHMPFEWKTEKEEILLNTLSNFKTGIPAFEINLKNYNCFEPKVVFVDVIENENLNLLQKAVVKQVKSNLNIFNQADDMRKYHPHVTIAFRDLKKEFFYLMMEEYRNKSFEANFLCNSFFLLKHTGKSWLPYKEFKFA